MLTRLDHIHQRAESQPEAVFNNLFSLINYQLIWHAFRRLKRGKAPGVDNVTLEDYEEDLRANLQDLLQRLHRGNYRPQAIRKYRVEERRQRSVRCAARASKQTVNSTMQFCHPFLPVSAKPISVAAELKTEHGVTRGSRGGTLQRTKEMSCKPR